MTNSTSQTIFCWYAVRTIYCRELKLKKQFEQFGIQSFIPMQYKTVVNNEEREYVETPAIHNLVFIYTSLAELEAKKSQIDVDFRFINDLVTGKPVEIPSSDMELFIRITQMKEEQIMYLRDNVERFKAYTPVRVVGGRFEGVEGYLVRITRDRKVVLLLKNVAAIAISGIHRSLIEVIENNP